MRRKDFSGAQEWIGAELFMSSRISCRLSARKTSASWRFVMMSVFEGGVGCTRGGMLERSMLIGLDLRLLETGRESGGEVGEVGVDNEDILGRTFRIEDTQLKDQREYL